MAIQRKSKSQEKDAQAFIEAATPTMKNRSIKKPVALRFDEPLLEKIDAAARMRGISRNAWISWQCAEGLKDD